jgi:type VI protein secretion system component VasK
VKPRTLWATSPLAALALAALLRVAFPYGPLGIVTPADREHAWLLSLWTLGVMCICFGGAGLASGFAPLGVREIAEKESVAAAIEARRAENRARAESRFYNFAGWVTATGAFLILAYFIAWALR